MERQVNYKTMRAVVGAIAFLLSPAVLLLADKPLSELTSISVTYWSASGDIFVGAQVAVGYFFFAYNGSGNGRDAEFYLTKVGSVCALLVAFFPTDSFSDSPMAPPGWTSTLAGLVGLEPTNVHFIAAVIIFLTLMVQIRFFAKRAENKGKTGRARLYRLIFWLMSLGSVVVSGIAWLLLPGHIIFVVEAWGLTLFGIGWFIAGTYKTEVVP